MLHRMQEATVCCKMHRALASWTARFRSICFFQLNDCRSYPKPATNNETPKKKSEKKSDRTN